MEKINCWEFKKCGREQGGKNVNELGVCPASVATKVDGINGGKNGGRACWAIAGSMCGGKVQGSFAQKYETCLECDFFKSVNHDKDRDDIITNLLLLCDND
jgi:hypothetical protein